MTRVATEGQDKAEDAEDLGLYVHVPFCSSTCDYCAFYQVKPTAEAIEGFIRGIGREAALVDWDRPIRTVFWGGGTPGLLSPRNLGRLAEAVRAIPGSRHVEEWTVELAPASATEARLRVLRDCGVSRISLGVQSFQPALLAALGRDHTAEQALRAYDRIRSAGFPSVNLDLIFALPGQTEAEWDADVDAAVGLQPDHLSTYCLTFEEDTALWVKLSQGRVKLDPDNEARLYEHTWLRLAQAGYAQYEISNFCRPGHACRHNLATWAMGSWVGLGPSAASQHRGWRGANPSDLAAWASCLDRGERAGCDRVELTSRVLAEDALIFGLRTNEGVDLERLRAAHPQVAWNGVGDLVARLQAEGHAQHAGGRLRLTTKGRLVADSVGAEILSAFEKGQEAVPLAP